MGKVLLILVFIVVNLFAALFFVLSPIISARLGQSGKMIVKTGIAPDSDSASTDIEGVFVPRILGWFYIGAAYLWRLARPLTVIVVSFIDCALIIWFLH